MNLTDKKVVIIGGAGLIGSHTVDQLTRTDVGEIIVYDNFVRGREANLADALADPRVKIYDVGGDILQTDVLQSALDRADGVFHFAALWLLQCHDFPRSAFDVNIRGTFNVLEACVAKNVKRLVYSSSASVYGDAVEEPMTEDHPFNNRNFYGATKIAGEAMARAFHHRHGLNVVGLRYMNVYGPRQDYRGAYIAVIMKMLDAIDPGGGPHHPRGRLGSLRFRGRGGLRARQSLRHGRGDGRSVLQCRHRHAHLAQGAGRAYLSSHRLQPDDPVRAPQRGDAGAQPDRFAEARQRGDRLHRRDPARRGATVADRMAEGGQGARPDACRLDRK